MRLVRMLRFTSRPKPSSVRECQGESNRTKQSLWEALARKEASKLLALELIGGLNVDERVFELCCLAIEAELGYGEI